MTDTPPFTVDVDLNPYLAEQATDVDMIVTVTAGDASAVTASVDRVEILIVDCSTSMTGTRMRAARDATSAAIAELPDGAHFAVIAGTQRATQIYPAGIGTTVATPDTRAEATDTVAQLDADGGTAIGTWLSLAASLADQHPGGIRHAILLTDGKNHSEDRATLRAAINSCLGRFTCDCRGVGTDWEVGELRAVASALLGSVDIVADPADLSADFRSIIDAALGKAVADVALRLWTPEGTAIRFVKQVAPTVEDLTERCTRLDALRGEYPLGSWGAETRDYHIGVRVPAGTIGDEKLAARVSVLRAGSDSVLGQGRAVVTWTDDTARSTRINNRVANYTGQAELASAIQEGLAARKNGDERTATARLGRAVALADEAGNNDTARLLSRVVEVIDGPSGTVALRKNVTEEDEMTLDTRSTRTMRVRPGTSDA